MQGSASPSATPATKQACHIRKGGVTAPPAILGYQAGVPLTAKFACLTPWSGRPGRAVPHLPHFTHLLAPSWLFLTDRLFWFVAVPCRVPCRPAPCCLLSGAHLRQVEVQVVDSEFSLPPGWRAARDPTSGYTYHIHASGTTQWEVPAAPSPSSPPPPPPSAAEPETARTSRQSARGSKAAFDEGSRSRLSSSNI